MFTFIKTFSKKLNTPISVVLITKNEEHNITRCITACKQLTDDIWVVDSGSIDNTIMIAQQLKAHVKSTHWQGYGATKNEGNNTAKHDWILSIDADEELTQALIQEIKTLFNKPLSEQNVYAIKRQLVYCGKVLKHGAVSNEYRIRIFNKKHNAWNLNPVHEELILLPPQKVVRLKNTMLHHSFNSVAQHAQKMQRYATLFNQQQDKKNVLKKWISPLFNFVKDYIFRGGFLDGKEGWWFAQQNYRYTQQKYK